MVTRCSRVSGRRGYSLFELAVVLAILGVVYAITAPRFAQARSQQQAEMSARRLAADIAYAQTVARSTSGPITVVFKVDGSSYDIVGVTDINDHTTPYTVDLTRAPFNASIASPSFDDTNSMTDLINELKFNGYGQPDSGGSVTIQVANHSRTITVDPETGQASIH